MQKNHNPTDPYATPDFDDWGWDSYWGQPEWITWHAALVKEFGQPQANDKFVNTWNAQTNFFVDFGDVRGDWITLDAPFREWLAGYTTSNGQTMLTALENTTFLGKPMGTGTDIVDNLLDGAGSLGNGVENTLKTLGWILPALLIVALIGAGFIIYKKANI